METRPITLAAANDFVDQHHRHNGRTARNGGKFATSVVAGGRLVGVAIVGNPLSATFMDGLTAEVLRVCTVPDAPKNACSMLYSACWRAWRSLGGDRMLTYTLQSESGVSLRAAGWELGGESGGVEEGWRKRDHISRRYDSVMAEPKYRWMAPGSRIEPRVDTVTVTPAVTARRCGAGCGRSVRGRSDASYCSGACRQKAYRRRRNMTSQGQRPHPAPMTLVEEVRAAIRPGDIKPLYRRENRPTAGACYVASEAIYHLAGGREAGLVPMRVKHEGVSHWWLRDADGNVIDPTADQFDEPVPYTEGKAGGFLTKEPSKRALALMGRINLSKVQSLGAPATTRQGHLALTFDLWCPTSDPFRPYRCSRSALPTSRRMCASVRFSSLLEGVLAHLGDDVVPGRVRTGRRGRRPPTGF